MNDSVVQIAMRVMESTSTRLSGDPDLVDAARKVILAYLRSESPVRVGEPDSSGN